MLDTSNWPEVELDVLKEIQLDPKNVRLEVADAKVEADIIEDLFVNEDALALVEGICKVGYLTHETPVVLKRRGKYVMVEGNRGSLHSKPSRTRCWSPTIRRESRRWRPFCQTALRSRRSGSWLHRTRPKRIS